MMFFLKTQTPDFKLDIKKYLTVTLWISCKFHMTF